MSKLVKASHKFARISPQKCRLVADLVKGKPVAEAVEVLNFSVKKGARLIAKVLQSALANAEHNVGLDIDELVVKNILVDQAPTYKRFKARAKGRASNILKRNSHITVVLSEVA